jgi:hypothetical protein
MKQKECGCFGAGHRSSCKHYVEQNRDVVKRFLLTHEGRAVWNAALDSAAIACDKVLECKAAARIRELKIG